MNAKTTNSSDFERLKSMSLDEIIEFVKDGGRKTAVGLWKKARAEGDDFLSDKLRYVLCGGVKPACIDRDYNEIDRNEVQDIICSHYGRHHPKQNLQYILKGVKKYAECIREYEKYEDFRKPERESFFAYA